MNVENRIGKNRRSPKNEEDCIAAYIKANPKAKRKDDMDIAAVITKDGIKGHGRLSESINRSHDTNYHRIIDFIADDELKKMN